jgi:phosphate acetyltransferase
MMAQAVFVVPTSQGIGLTTVAVGLFHALDRRGIPAGFLKPIAQLHAFDTGPERSTRLVELISSFTPPQPIARGEAEALFGQNLEDRLLEEVVARYDQAAQDADIVILEGLVPTAEQPYATRLNADVARTLGARVILVAAPGDSSPSQLANHLELAAQPFGGVHHERVLGAILNQVGAPPKGSGWLRLDVGDVSERAGAEEARIRAECPIFKDGFKLFGCIPWERELLAPRVSDVQRFLHAEVLYEGNLDRRVTDIALGASTMIHAAQRMTPGTFFITSGDRDDLILAAAMAALSGRHVAALLLTNGRRPSEELLSLCEKGLATGLPVLLVPQDSFQSALKVRGMNLEVPLDDAERIDLIVRRVARQLDLDGLKSQLRVRPSERRMSPPAFRHMLIERARAAARRIVLPEGDEPRTVRAAAICHERRIAHCVLLGDPDDILHVAARQGVTLPDDVEIINPPTILGKYIEPMVALRKHKGLIPAAAEELLQDSVVLGTMMLKQGDVDGLVSGAVHTTANTIRPAFQLIKTAPGVRIVSSIFFMLLPEQVLVYGDCAVNPNPTAEELADIALQSAESAQAFGIEPRVAMLSYSTGASGGGSDVEKVREATRIAQERRPDLLIDGPLQYDAAAIKDVAKSKAPGSKVAGRATVFIFPDLNTGNTTYKAVQRSAEVISVGPMLQGLRKPVNDLSRGALVEDIVYTVALTAIQAEQAEKRGREASAQTA